LALGLIAVLSALFHELGHASASSYGGAPPGAIGAGIYVVWPAFFTDITESYRLNRLGRVRTDLGGIYFNLLLTLPLGYLYLLTGNPLWRWAVLAQFLIIFQQCLPFLRLDAYYLVSDLTGVPDLFGHLRPALAGLVPGREVGAGVARLRPKVRIAVTAWAMGTVAFIAWFASVMILGLPALAETAWTLATSLGSAASANLSRGRYGIAGAAVIQLLLVSIQFLGLAVVLKRIVRPRRLDR
jgi:putative peptide zinc metalloprotease protein